MNVSQASASDDKVVPRWQACDLAPHDDFLPSAGVEFGRRITVQWLARGDLAQQCEHMVSAGRRWMMAESQSGLFGFFSSAGWPVATAN